MAPGHKWGDWDTEEVPLGSQASGSTVPVSPWVCLVISVYSSLFPDFPTGQTEFGEILFQVRLAGLQLQDLDGTIF